MSGVCCCKTRAAREEELPTLSVYVLRVLISLLSSVRALWRRAGLQQRCARLELCRLGNWHASRSDTDQRSQHIATCANESKSTRAHW